MLLPLMLCNIDVSFVYLFLDAHCFNTLDSMLFKNAFIVCYNLNHYVKLLTVLLE